MGVLESYLAGREARRVESENQRVNAMQEFMQANGQAIYNGDQNALGQLAQYDPQAALQLRGMQDDRARTAAAAARAEKADARGDQEWQMQVEAWAADKTAAERADAAAKIEASVKTGLALPDAASWDSYMTQNAPDLVGQFDQREAIATQYLSVADALKMNDPVQKEKDRLGLAKTQAEVAALENPQPDWTEATQDEAKARGYNFGQINRKTGEFKGTQGPSSGITLTNPDGTSVQIGGTATAGGKPTEGNLSSAGYLQRMTGAEKIMDELSDKGVKALSIWDEFAVGTKVESFKLSSDEQRLLQAQRDWVRAKLRKESGAVISPEEEANEIRTYFPQPGDESAVIKQKRESRKAAEKQLEIGSGVAAGEAGPLTDAGALPSVEGLSPDAQEALRLYGGE